MTNDLALKKPTIFDKPPNQKPIIICLFKQCYCKKYKYTLYYITGLKRLW